MLVEVSNPKEGAILHIKSPFIGMRFEWHPLNKIVYVIHEDGKQSVGEPVAVDILDHGAAITAVLIWGRGYRTAQRGQAFNGKRSS